MKCNVKESHIDYHKILDIEDMRIDGESMDEMIDKLD